MQSDSILDSHLARLNNAISRQRKRETCHRHWSLFIRARDGYRCVICDATNDIAAHHVVRRSLLREAQYLTGNGATLCGFCHKEAHQGYNGPPDFSVPIDMQGGEKLEAVAELYRVLAKQAGQNHPGRNDYYHLTDQVLQRYKMMQGLELGEAHAGTPIEQAWWIWDRAPLQLVEAIIRANMPNAST